MLKEYTHSRIGEEVQFISGYYVIDEERQIPFHGRALLVVFGHAIVDNSCCGRGGCRYALIPGYVARWKFKTDDKGMNVSEVEPITKPEERQEIKKYLQEHEYVQQVNFI